MHSKQGPSCKAQPGRVADTDTHTCVKETHHSMEHGVDQMIPHGLQLVEQVVETEGGHTERSVRLMTGGTAHGRAPEVMCEEATPWRGGVQVLVLLDGWLIIIHYPAGQCVEVHQYS